MTTDDPQSFGRLTPGPVVRPYAITGGRARSRHEDLEVEALVSTTSLGELAPNLSYERRAVARLCRDVQSIAEVSARLDLPLGVARVLVSDMSHEGLVMVHRPAQIGERPDLALLERVLFGLRNI